MGNPLLYILLSLLIMIVRSHSDPSEPEEAIVADEASEAFLSSFILPRFHIILALSPSMSLSLSLSSLSLSRSQIYAGRVASTAPLRLRRRRRLRHQKGEGQNEEWRHHRNHAPQRDTEQRERRGRALAETGGPCCAENCTLTGGAVSSRTNI